MERTEKLNKELAPDINRGRFQMHNELTRKDIADMEAEIEHRKIVVRKERVEHGKEARAQGDLSENFEYYAAKKAKNENESRIRFLERMIKTARVIEDHTAKEEAGMNKTVKVRICEIGAEDGDEETYKIVTTMRGDSLKGLISIESPLGKALIGHKAGDRVRVSVSPDYSYEAVILSVEDTGLSETDALRNY